MTLSRSRNWRLIETEPSEGAWNMAVDEALMESVRNGAAPALRLYRWSKPCVSLGRNQPTAGAFDAPRVAASGADVVRRPTGGRALLHDIELTYAVVAADREFGSARGAYRAINEVLVAGLRGLGADVETADDTGSVPPPPSTVPCFADPVAGEVLAGGRKLVGSAQLRAGGVLLQHGSVPLRPGDTGAGAALGFDLPASRPAYLECVLARPILWETLVASLTAAWAGAVGCLTPAGLDPTETGLARALLPKYRSDGWTWRR